MSDLTEFLLARIAEDEAEIGRWQAAMEADEIAAVGVPSWVVMAGGLKIPARVLAECDAKRRIVEAHKPYRRIYGLGCDVCLPPRHLPADAPGWPCATLRLLAASYADHPDYRQEWRP